MFLDTISLFLRQQSESNHPRFVNQSYSDLLGDLALHDARQYSCYTNKARTDFHKLSEMKPEKKTENNRKIRRKLFHNNRYQKTNN